MQVEKRAMFFRGEVGGGIGGNQAAELRAGTVHRQFETGAKQVIIDSGLENP